MIVVLGPELSWSLLANRASHCSAAGRAVAPPPHVVHLWSKSGSGCIPRKHRSIDDERATLQIYAYWNPRSRTSWLLLASYELVATRLLMGCGPCNRAEQYKLVFAALLVHQGSNPRRVSSKHTERLR